MAIKLDVVLVAAMAAHSAHFIDLWYDCFHDVPISARPMPRPRPMPRLRLSTRICDER